MKNCEICGRAVDARGYNVHLRKCKEVQTTKLEQIQQDTNMKPDENDTDDKSTTVAKNSKTLTMAKITAAVLGIIVAAICWILMSILPKSKESSTKPKPSSPQGLRRHR